MLDIETITITVGKYNQLLESYEFLCKLYAAGVDNWEGYSDCLEEDEED